MKYIVEIIIAFIGIYLILKYNSKIFVSFDHLTLFLSIYLFFVIFDIINNMKNRDCIKSNVILSHNFKSASIAFVSYILLFELLSKINEINNNVKYFLIAIIIALLTKIPVKKYNLSYF